MSSHQDTTEELSNTHVSIVAATDFVQHSDLRTMLKHSSASSGLLRQQQHSRGVSNTTTEGTFSCGGARSSNQQTMLVKDDQSIGDMYSSLEEQALM